MSDQVKYAKDEAQKKALSPENKKKEEDKKNDDPALIQDVIDSKDSFTERPHKRTHVRSEDSTPDTI
ncbi:hypothetical protein [Olivibacter sitiensis]|uniref:hypothetical protein n=1 Tax=Olivibacter sitiensis TaxID=376470 RepID=UPI000409E69C|nr:hypothetical protein [Olivibacter sitiensis]